MADDSNEAGPGVAPAAAAQGGDRPTVQWDDSNMRTSFANVVNGTSTREEVTLFFGTNKTWNLNDVKELKVELSDRIILTPYAAKRLWILIGNILRQYEQRFGTLHIEATPSVPDNPET